MSPPAPDNSGKDVASNDHALDIFFDRAKELFAQQQRRAESLEADLSKQIEAAIEGIKVSEAYVEDREKHFAQLDEKLAQALEERDQALESRTEADSLLEEARSSNSQDTQDQHELRVELSQCHKQLNVRADELKELRTRLKNFEEGQTSNLADELRPLEAERDALRVQLTQAQQQLTNGARGSSDDSSELDELRQRFETAVQEIRELKTSNKDLTTRLSDSPKREEDSGDGFDWEAQKRRLMSQLESDFDESDEQQSSDKLTVEGTIRITDQMIATKDGEIAELKQLLDNQSSSIGDVAVGAAAIVELLDQDELISQERDSLKRQQDEWRDKLRQAEIDISVERARLGRERMELQSQIQAIERERAAHETFLNGEQLEDAKPGGRWLKRLGLKDD